nr:MAG TPA: hypothetical protein [Caudoviricetes sp.]
MRFICDLICDHFLRPLFNCNLFVYNILNYSVLKRYFWSQRI